MYMDNSKQSLGNIAILAHSSRALFIFSYGLLHEHQTLYYRNIRKAGPMIVVLNLNLVPIKFQIDELELAFEKASMPNKTVIIALVNKAYVDETFESQTTMFDLFLESFWLGEDARLLLDHLLLVAVDQTAYDRCMFKRLHCYKLETDGVNFAGAKLYMSEDFVRMMWRGTPLLTDILKRGYNFVFTVRY